MKTIERLAALALDAHVYRLLRDKKVIADLVAILGKKRPGAYLLGASNTVRFASTDDLKELAAGEDGEFFAAVLKDVNLALTAPDEAKFHPNQDAVIALLPELDVYETVGKREVRVRSWWARPGSRAVKLVNLSQDPKIVYATVLLGGN